jgi:hypothetical protein
MGLSHSPNIVTDGLVLCLDAANRRSYPGNGNTWYDLSGNDNHAVASAVSYNTSQKSFYSISGATSKFSVPAGDLKNSEVTVEAIIKTTVLQDGWIFSLQASSSSNYTKGYLLRMDHPDYHILWSPPAFRVVSSGIVLNTWQHITCTAGANEQKMYVNGENRGSWGGLTLDYTDVRDYAYIGAFDASGFLPMMGYINSVRVYNKALSANEVQRNYLATKSRFGL